MASPPVGAHSYAKATEWRHKSSCIAAFGAPKTTPHVPVASPPAGVVKALRAMPNDNGSTRDAGLPSPTSSSHEVMTQPLPVVKPPVGAHSYAKATEWRHKSSCIAAFGAPQTRPPVPVASPPAGVVKALRAMPNDNGSTRDAGLPSPTSSSHEVVTHPLPVAKPPVGNG